MTLPNTSPNQPFRIEHLRLHETAGVFEPAARLSLRTELRTCGLLARLSDEQTRTLLALLAHLRPNGIVQATSEDVAQILGQSEAQSRERLTDLTRVLWRDRPLVHQIGVEVRLPLFVLSSLTTVHEDTAINQLDEQPTVSSAGREAVIAWSRATYGTPREVAEQMVAEQLGHSVEETQDTPAGEARRRLFLTGVTRDEIELLLRNYPVEQILQQLDWLPERGARKPARFIVAAIVGNYAPPLSVTINETRRVRSNESTALDTNVSEDSDIEAEMAPVDLPIPQPHEGGSDA